MKKTILIFLLQILYTTCHAQYVKAELQASGLTCSMCSFATQKQLKTLDFIDSIGADLNHTIFILYFKKDKVVEPAQIKQKVEDAGFSVASLKITFDFDAIKTENNNYFICQNNLYHFTGTTPSSLKGNIILKIFNKGFVSDKEYKKHLKSAMQTPALVEKITTVNKIYDVTAQ
jgi:copper chaperone CopZ